MRPHVRERRVLTHAHGPVRLHGAIDDLERDIGHFNFSLGDLLERILCVFLIDLNRRVEHNHSARVDFDPGLGHPFEQNALFGQGFAKGDFPLVIQPVDQPLQSLFAGSDGTHGVVDPSRAQTSLHDFVTSALAQDNGFVRAHSHVLERDVSVTVRRVVVPVHAEHAVHGNSRRVGRHEQHALLLVLVRVGWVGLAHDNEDFAAVVAGARGPPFAPVQDVLVAPPVHAELDVGAVGRRDVGLRHQEARANLTGEKRPEPAVLLGRRAVACNDFHVARVGGGAVAGLQISDQTRDQHQPINRRCATKTHSQTEKQDKRKGKEVTSREQAQHSVPR